MIMDIETRIHCRLYKRQLQKEVNKKIHSCCDKPVMLQEEKLQLKMASLKKLYKRIIEKNQIFPSKSSRRESAEEDICCVYKRLLNNTRNIYEVDIVFLPNVKHLGIGL